MRRAPTRQASISSQLASTTASVLVSSAVPTVSSTVTTSASSTFPSSMRVSSSADALVRPVPPSTVRSGTLASTMSASTPNTLPSSRCGSEPLTWSRYLPTYTTRRRGSCSSTSGATSSHSSARVAPAPSASPSSSPLQGVKTACTRTAWSSACGPWNVALVVLMMGLVVAAVALPFLAWNDNVLEQQLAVDMAFEKEVATHEAALRQAWSHVDSQVEQLVVFLQQSRSLQSYAAFSGQHVLADFTQIQAFAQLVRRSERSAYEAQLTSEYREFYNDSSFVGHITDLNTMSGRAGVTTSVAAERDEYLPLTYTSLPSPFLYVGRDVLTETHRASTVGKARSTRSATLSQRLIVFAEEPYASSLLVRPIYSFTNSSQLLGVLAIDIRLEQSVTTAVAALAPSSLRVRTFDITGDRLDQTGCLKPSLFDGVRDGDTGEWDVAPVSLTDCPSNPEELVRPDDATFVFDAYGRQLLFVVSRGPSFDDMESSLGTDMLAASVVVAFLAIVAIGAVLLRGWRLIASLHDAQFQLLESSQRTKDFYAFITHELRNPLFAMLGVTSDMESHVATGNVQQVDTLLSMVRLSAERMSSIINDVLSMRKLEEGKLEFEHARFSLRHIADEIFAMFSSRARQHGLQLVVVVDPYVPTHVLGDAGRLVQVISNFVSNAIKFTEAGGYVQVRIAEARWPRWMRECRSAPTLNKMRCVRVDVTDSGPGIRRSSIPYLFRPYSQESARIARMHGGTGLGLSICKQLAEGMGGVVHVKSRVGFGSVFSVLLPFEVEAEAEVEPASPAPVLKVSPIDGQPPASQRMSLPHVASMSEIDLEASAPTASASAPAPAPAPAASPSSTFRPSMAHSAWAEASHRVLIADDYSVNVSILSQLFRRCVPDLRIDAAADGREAVDAVERAEREGDPYALVLLDVRMPGVDGRQAVRELRATGYMRPILAVSGSGTQQDLDANAAAGFDTTVIKPLREATALSLLRRFLDVPESVLERHAEDPNVDFS